MTLAADSDLTPHMRRTGVALEGNVTASFLVFGLEGREECGGTREGAGEVGGLVGADPTVVTVPREGAGYVHELAEVQRCLDAGLRESPGMPHAATLEVMDVLDAALQQLGAVHADDPDLPGGG